MLKPQNLIVITSPEGMMMFPLRDVVDREVEQQITDLRSKYGQDKIKVRRFVGDFRMPQPDGPSSC